MDSWIWLQEPGECCGFSAVSKDALTVEWKNNVCGKGILNEGSFTMAKYKTAVEKIPPHETTDYDEWGEATLPIDGEVEILLDKYERDIYPEVFHLQYSGK